MRWSGFVSIAALAFVCMGCGSSIDVKGLREQARRIEVVKTAHDGSFEEKRVIESTDSIGQLLSVVSNKDAPQVACLYDYEYRCFDDESELFFLVQLNSAHLCQGAVFKHDGELHYRYLSNDGAEYLKSLFN